MEKSNRSIPVGGFLLLNSPNSKGEKCIYLRYYLGIYYKKSTDIWVKPSDWDQKAQKVLRTNRMAERLNYMLLVKKHEVDGALMDYEGKITSTVLRAIMNGKDPNEIQKETLPSETRDFVTYCLKVNDLNYSKKAYGYTTWYNKKKSIEAFEWYVKYYLRREPVTLDDVNLEIFDQYIAYRMDVKKNKSKEGINKTLVPLYDALKYALKNGLVEQKQVGVVVDNYLQVRETEYNTRLSEREDRVRYLTPEQLSKLYQYSLNIKRERAREIMDMFFFSYYACGMRMSDILTLEWNHIDLENKVIRKPQFKTKKYPEVPTPLSNNAIEILERWKGYKRNNRFVFDLLPEDFDIDNQEKLYMQRNSKDKTFNRSLLTIGRNAKMPFDITMHTARHSFAVMAINSGISIYLVSKLMGHTSIAATEKTYAEFLKSKVDKDVQAIMSMSLGA